MFLEPELAYSRYLHRTYHCVMMSQINISE